MKAYLDILQKILEKGQRKSNRTGIDTLVIPFVHFEHDMSTGFPLLTTKKMPFKMVAAELWCFINGITSKKVFQDNNCPIWNEWANPRVVEQTLRDRISVMEDKPDEETVSIMRKQIQKEEDDLGPVYGYSWRKFNEVYDEDDEGSIKGVDQLKIIVDTLHKNPNDRRMVCSAWNPQQMSRMALPPCHILWNVVVIGDTINLGWYQR